jgi:hypothetical protein
MLKKNKSEEKESNVEKKKKKKEKCTKHQTKQYCTFPSCLKRLNKKAKKF